MQPEPDPGSRKRGWGTRPSSLVLLLALLIAPGCGTSKSPFDYWVLALSWSPEFCASGGAQKAPEQCARRRGFIVHGLWPQYETGYPEFCDTRAPVPDALVQRMAPWMPGAGLVRHQWKKHGTCSGLLPENYFAVVERAAQRVKVPDNFLRENAATRVERNRLEQAFLDLNPGWRAQGIAVQCRGAQLHEIRLCLDLDLNPRDCGPDVRDACGAELKIRPGP